MTQSTMVATAPGAWKITALLFVYMMINFADKIAVGLAGAPIMKEMNLTPEQFGLVGSSFFFLPFYRLLPVDIWSLLGYVSCADLAHSIYR